ncbi:MAG: ElyC/SanA/YdcF family protein [Patescibacteria group bacterium]
MTKVKYKISFWISFVLMILITVFWFIQMKVDNFQDNIIYNIENVPTSSVALVFGASVFRNGTLSGVLEDRVETAVELYKNDKVKKILMTGDNGSSKYNEVVPMKDYAISKGVNPEDIILDYAGFDTYDSCYRAKEIFDLNNYEVIAVSQKFHLNRITYICENLGVKVYPLIADRHKYVDIDKMIWREIFAKIKAFFEIEFLHLKPKYLGEKVNVF